MTADPDLVGMLTREELVRKVTQVYTLERLAVQDVATALPLLLALAQVNLSPEPLSSGPGSGAGPRDIHGWNAVVKKSVCMALLVACALLPDTCTSDQVCQRCRGQK